MWLLIAWYAYCILLIWTAVTVYRLINTQKFRDEGGDITTEVGYQEDPAGNIRQPRTLIVSASNGVKPHSPYPGIARDG